MKNMWLEIAKEYGVEVEEVFKIKEICSGNVYINDYKINETGFYRFESICDEWVIPYFTNNFIQGKYEIIKKPFVPKLGEKYFRVNDKGLILEDTFYGYSPDLYNLEYGNCYRTSKEAENNIEKHMKQFEEIKQKAGIE